MHLLSSKYQEPLQWKTSLRGTRSHTESKSTIVSCHCFREVERISATRDEDVAIVVVLMVQAQGTLGSAYCKLRICAVRLSAKTSRWSYWDVDGIHKEN